MVNGSLLVSNGKKIIINRAYKSTPDYTVPSQVKVGINNTTPNVVDTNLDYAVPIDNGTVNDNGDANWTGSAGGDNTTDNSTTYKEGAGQSDNKSQNMIANAGSASKTWTLTPLTANVVGTKPYALWLYIKDATTYAKFLNAGTAFEIRFRTNGDAANKYYYQLFTKSQLASGWNWITSNTTNVNAIGTGAGGVPTGNINEVIIIITTNNATDTFVAGDVLYDLLRQWQSSDLFKNYDSGYPTIDETNFETVYNLTLLSTEANGFNINAQSNWNTDGTELMSGLDVINNESKSSTDQFIFIITDRLI